jgi:hypothetical protein
MKALLLLDDANLRRMTQFVIASFFIHAEPPIHITFRVLFNPRFELDQHAYLQMRILKSF